MSLEKKRVVPLKVLSLGTCVFGAVYGILARIAFGSKEYPEIFGVMTFAFIFVVPLVIGFLTVRLAPEEARRSWLYCLFMPWIAGLICLAALLAFAYEGLICLVMMGPVMLALASVGGVLARLITKRGPVPLAAFAALPFLVGPLEQKMARHNEIRKVENTIVIDAPADVVWRNIASVPEIRKDEAKPSWSHKIGFPMPLAATLSHEGVGGVRQATFERGILFVETVDLWEPGRRLGFGIKADPVPATTLDEHVTVGGPYFDVLRGEYDIEPAGEGKVLLRLWSEHRVTTTFNTYAAVWTDAVMSDVQSLILGVIKNRAESRR